MAYVKTFASTYTRIELIKTQFRVALRRSTLINSSNLEKIEKGIDNRWIKDLGIYAYNNQKLCRGELKLMIDWQKYDLHIHQGNVQVAIDENLWENQVAIEVDEAIRLFNKFVKANNLTTDWAVYYPSHLDGDFINRQLGFVTLSPIQWVKGKGISHVFNIDELDECKVGLYLK